MMPFTTGTGLERMRSSGRTETADGLDWWMLDCLGWGRIAVISTCGLRCGAPLQKNQKEGPTRALPATAPMPKSDSF